MENTPTPAERRVLQLLKRRAQHLTLREMAELLDCSHVTVYGHLQGLLAKGLVKVVNEGKARRYVAADRCPTCGQSWLKRSR